MMPAEPTAAAPLKPALGLHRIDTGSAELLRDLDRPNAYLLMINEMESSYVDLDDPSLLDFEYLRWMAALIEHLAPDPSQFLSPRELAADPLKVVHLGAAACTLARHLLVVRPNSRHLAVDLDAALLTLLSGWFQFPAPPALEIAIGDARRVTESLLSRSSDVVVRDVFAGPVTPWNVTTREFLLEVRRVLRPGGLYLMNCADTPDLTLARSEAATLATVFDHVLLTADPSMLKGRRRGNVVMVGSDHPMDAPLLARSLLAGAVPAQLWTTERVRQFAATNAVRRDMTT